MIISNFREYLDCLRNLFVNDNANSVDAYLQDMAQSGKKQREYKEKLQREIAVITAKINFLRQEMKQENDIRKISEQIKKLKENKTLLLKRLKQKTQTTRFAMLSDETKATLCTLKILRKYLTKELMENEFSGMKKDDNGNLIFDAKVFEDSFLYQDARHIYDYVSAYIIQNPGRVVSESHFNKFFDKESGWRGIVNQANKFFDAQNKRRKTRAEIIAESKSDIEFIREYPDNRVLLVRLKTPEALDYEGTAAHNCVGGGTYDKLLSKKHSGIYSLRRLTKDGELKPVVTIEYNDGVVKQVRGICNSIVAFDYNLSARDVVLRLMGKDNIADLVANDTIKNDVLNSLGIYRDGKCGFLDIHNVSGDEDFVLPKLIVDGDSLGDYEFEKLKIKQLQIEGLLPENTKYLSKFKGVKDLTINQIEDGIVLDLSGFDCLTSLTTELKKGSGKIINLPKSVSHLTYKGDNVLQASGEVETIWIQCSGENKINLDDIPSARQIEQSSKGNIELLGDRVYPRLEKLSFDGDLLSNVCAEKFPNLMELSCADVKSLGYIPSLKKITITRASETTIDLSNNPQLQLIQIKGAETKLHLADYYPNLKNFKTENVCLDLFDVKNFPQLENLNLDISGSCMIRFSPDSKLKSVFIGSAKNDGSVFTFDGQLNGKEKLCINNVNASVFLNDNIGFGEVEFQNSCLNSPLPDCFNNMKTFFNNTRLGPELCRQIAVINVDSRNRDNGAAPVIDFSDCQNVDFSSFAVLPTERLILPEKMEKLVLNGTLFPKAEIVGGQQIRSLSLGSNYNNSFFDRLDYDYIEELRLASATQNDFISKCPNLKKLNCTMLPLENIPSGVTDLTYHSDLGIVFCDEEPKQYFGDVIDFSCLNNLKRLNLSLNFSRIKSIKLPPNIENLVFRIQLTNMQELDLSSYSNLKKISLRISFAKDFGKIILPETVEELDAGRGDMDSIGYPRLEKKSDEPAKVYFEIPQTAKPEVIAYLQKEWGKDNVILVPPKNRKEQILLPVMVMQQKTSRR